MTKSEVILRLECIPSKLKNNQFYCFDSRGKIMFGEYLGESALYENKHAVIIEGNLFTSYFDLSKEFKIGWDFRCDFNYNRFVESYKEKFIKTRTGEKKDYVYTVNKSTLKLKKYQSGKEPSYLEKYENLEDAEDFIKKKLNDLRKFSKKLLDLSEKGKSIILDFVKKNRHRLESLGIIDQDNIEDEDIIEFFRGISRILQRFSVTMNDLKPGDKIFSVHFLGNFTTNYFFGSIFPIISTISEIHIDELSYKSYIKTNSGKFYLKSENNLLFHAKDLEEIRHILIFRILFQYEVRINLYMKTARDILDAISLFNYKKGINTYSLPTAKFMESFYNLHLPNILQIDLENFENSRELIEKIQIV